MRRRKIELTRKRFHFKLTYKLYKYNLCIVEGLMSIEILDRSASKTTRQFVYDTLKKNIISLKLEPGAAISENEISELLHVSRTPIRESFIKLAEEDLIEIYPQRGTFVSLIDLRHVEEALFVRENLEVAVARLACEMFTPEDVEDLEDMLASQNRLNDRQNYPKLFELDEEFHRVIFSKCGKTNAWALVQNMYNHYKRVRLLLLATKFDWGVILRQHTEMIECIKNRQPDRIETVMKEHLGVLVFEKTELKEKYPNYFK